MIDKTAMEVLTSQESNINQVVTQFEEVINTLHKEGILVEVLDRMENASWLKLFRAVRVVDGEIELDGL